MRLHTSKIGLLIGLMLSTSVFANVSVVRDNANEILLKVTESYTLGDNDTLSNAKGLIIEQAKKSATDYAGTYVESELKVSNNQITKQQVRVLSAGFMEVLTSVFHRSVNKSGSIVLDTETQIRLSKKSITDGLAKLKSDPERKAKIDDLEKDNKRLRKELIQLSIKINSSNSSRTDLMVAREKVLVELDKNREAAKQVFEEGTLFQLAMLDDNDYELAKKDIDENVFGYLVHETQVNIGKPKFVKNENGNYDISIPVQWNLKKSPAKAVLDKYFKTESRVKNGHMGDNIPYVVGIYSYNNDGDDAKHQYTEKLYKYMNKKVVAIRISAADKYGYLPFADEVSYSYALQFSNDSQRNTMLNRKLRNPVIIKDLTQSQLKAITSISAKVVLLDRGTLRRWKYE